MLHDLASAYGLDTRLRGLPPGTQNYTAQASTQYGNNQAFAKLFKGQTSQLIGFHYFNDADHPVFTQVDASNNQIGFVEVTKAASVPQGSAADDGGFGSVPLLLLNTVSAGGEWWPAQYTLGSGWSRPWWRMYDIAAEPKCCAGTLSDVTHVQRLATKGGAIPTGLFT